MKIVALAGENPERWRLRAALREKIGLTDAQIDELIANTEPIDFVEFVMGIEEAHGIEIEEEDFLTEGTQDRGDPPS